MSDNQPSVSYTTPVHVPAVVLVEPQLGENIGAVARAMLNTELTDLRLVRPRDGWPNERAVASASGADLVLESARVYDSTAEALADCDFVLATTARRRDMTKRVFSARAAAPALRAEVAAGRNAAVLFGPERTGLHNDDVMRADAIINVPLNPDFSSLNLAQSVLLVAYEWYTAGVDAALLNERVETMAGRFATQAELDNLHGHLERALEAGGFFPSPDMRPTIVRNLRNLFQRAHMTEQEVRTFHGVIVALGRAGPDAGKKNRRSVEATREAEEQGAPPSGG